MNTYTKPKSSYSGGGIPCGCGTAGGTQTAAGCSCSGGDTGCARCRNQGYVRPQFFAGQLLTEEDLQALSDYVVSKNRLHNRYLFGEGVVCGLEVTCHPCGGGVVIVNPGYALDCCGNDIQLPCAQELDINAMVRDLRRDMLGGYSCGDPCAPKKKVNCPPEDQETEQGAGDKENDPASGIESTETQAADPSRYYCLYVRYCEELTDPVSPYATDESCGFQSCEPTRVREGVRFELRCEETGKPHVDLFSRILGCIGDLATAEKSARSVLSLNVISQYRGSEASSGTRDSYRTSLNARRGEAAKITESLKASFGGEAGARANEKKRSAGSDAAASQPAPAGSQAMKDKEFEEAVHNIRKTASLLATYQLAAAEPPLQEDAGRADAGVNEKEIAELKQSLRRAVEIVRPQINAKLSSPLERSAVYAIVDGAAKVASDNPAEQPQAKELVDMYEGSFTNTKFQVEMSNALQELRENLLDRLDRKIMLTDCSLRQKVRAIVIPSGTTGGDKEQFDQATRELIEAWISYLVDCICLALNPACAPCDDTGVLLACVEVQDCEVVDICNMSRSFVLTAPAMRYWLPPLRMFGELLEKLCCGDITLPENEKETQAMLPDRLITLSSGRSTRNSLRSAGNIAAKLASARGARLPFNQATISNTIASTLGRVMSSNTLSRVLSSEPVQRAVTANPEILRMAASIISPTTTEAAAADVGSRIEDAVAAALNKEKLAETVAESLAEAPVRAALDSIVDERLKKETAGQAIATNEIAEVADERITAALDKAKLGTISTDLKELKRLKTENAELKKQFTDLEKRLKKLEG